MLSKGINLTTQLTFLCHQRENPRVLSPLSFLYLSSYARELRNHPQGAPRANEKKKLPRSWPESLLPQQPQWCCRKRWLNRFKTTSSCKNQTTLLRTWIAQILFLLLNQVMFGVISWLDKWRTTVSFFASVIFDVQMIRCQNRHLWNETHIYSPVVILTD